MRKRRRGTSAAAWWIGGADYSLVDFNRGGTPLVEIVTGPDVHSSEEARRFLQLLRQTIVELRDLGRGDGEGDAPRRRERLGAPEGRTSFVPVAS